VELFAIFPPLAGFLLAGLFGRYIGDRGAQFFTCLAVLISTAASVMLFGEVVLEANPYMKFLGEWFSSGDLAVHWALRLDQLSVLMILTVNIISACVHIYSIGYMAMDKSKARFFAYLNLFTFAMLLLVISDNLLQLFLGWEGVGLTSYLLIGFWNHKPSAALAADKAFIMNRTGDAAFLLGIFACFGLAGSIYFDDIFKAAQENEGARILEITGLLLFAGAVGKSAQLGLHTWLPDAMEGPTPVSALIHAATMVTAGVFLIVRFSPLYEYAPLALSVICVVGALTAFIGATIALTQFDIKRVIAYSTMSQLGYMFFALGVSAYSAAMFHLFTHAFFKALLFLGAGSVIHALSGEHDMRKMGGIWKMLPVTYVMMWIGALALAGVPFLAGFYSKDIILEAAWADHSWFGNLAFWMGIAAAVMTAFYSWRLIIMTFHGSARADDKVMAHVRESPDIMTMPLTVLAAGAIFAGSMFYGGFAGEPVNEVIIRDGVEYTNIWNREYFWGESIQVLDKNDTVSKAHLVPEWVKILPVLAAIIGIALAYLVYMRRRDLPGKLSSSPVLKPLYLLFYRKWFFDDVYNAAIVRPLLAVGAFFSGSCDRGFIDRFGPDGGAFISKKLGAAVSRIQSGRVFQYAFVMIISLVAILSWFIIRAQTG
jgi:NADH-quinone oxidoreductase subunit L